MINKIYTLLSLSLALILAGCNDDSVYTPEQPLPGSPGTLTIRFQSAKGSRSEKSDKSEDLIDNITIALYTDGIEENIAPVEVKTFTGLKGDGETSVTMYLTNDMVDQLFLTPNKTSCRIFSVANVPSGTTVPDKPTIEQLKSIAISSSFMTVPEQESFVMAGSGSVGYSAPAGTGTNSLGTASGNCNLSRAAAKISLNVKLPRSITVINADRIEETWSPVTAEGNLIAYINNGVKTAVAYPVNPIGQPSWKPSGQNAADSYYNSDPTKANTYRLFNNVGSETVKETEYVTDSDGNVTETEKDVTYDIFGINVPFYTYPNAWSVNNYEDTSQTTLTLIVRWHKGTENEWTNYYYQVPVTPTDIFQLDANHSYTVTLKVGMLGSLVPDKPLEVEGTYQVMSWSNTDVNVDINDYRYLVVNPNNISVNNEAEVTIPFYSSHEVELSSLSMTFQRFNFYSDGNGEVVDITVPKETIDESVSDGKKMVSYEIVTDPITNQKSLKINHPLEIWNASNGIKTITFTNKGSNIDVVQFVEDSVKKFERPVNPEIPYSSYVFNIKIQHEGNSSYSQDITLTQYPGMYIEAKPNPGGSYNTSNYLYGYTSDYGFVFVNPTLTQGSRRDYWTNSTTLGGVHGVSGDNSNPNMYVINISQLGISSEYYIGDPRMSYTNNDLSTQTGGNNNRRYPDLAIATTDGDVAGDWCNEANALYKQLPNGSSPDTRRLAWYYPTIESKDDEYKMRVAPKFRIASSYGKTNAVNRDNARRRMATYQEVGCPAGRWRLPTYGELQFIASLSSSGKIPDLFTRGSSYWTAQGPCTVNNDGTVDLIEVDNNAYSSYYVRGVYDEWYWEQFPEYSISPETNGQYVYTLGDMPKQSN